MHFICLKHADPPTPHTAHNAQNPTPSVPPPSMTNDGDATSSLAAQLTWLSLEYGGGDDDAPPAAPTLTVEALPTVLLQEIALFVGLPEASATLALASRCLRSAYTTSVTGLTLRTAPLPTDLLVLLRQRPSVVSLTIHGAWAISALSVVVRGGLCRCLRTLSLVYPSAAPPTALARYELSAAFGTGQLPALEAIRIQHTGGAGSGGLEPTGLAMLMGLAEAINGGTGPCVPSPRWASLAVPVPLTTQDLVRLASILQKRHQARAQVQGQEVAPLSLPDRWWWLRNEDPPMTAYNDAVGIGVVERQRAQYIMDQMAEAVPTYLSTLSPAEGEQVLVRTALTAAIWKEVLMDAMALGSEEKPLSQTVDKCGLTLTCMLVEPDARYPSITTLVLGDGCSLFMKAIINGRFPNLRRLSFHASLPGPTADTLYVAAQRQRLERCTSLTFKDIDFSDKEKWSPLIFAIFFMPHLCHLRIERCGLPEGATGHYLALLLGKAEWLPPENSIYGSIALLKDGLFGGRTPGGGASMESLAVAYCTLTSEAVNHLLYALAAGGFPVLRTLDLRGNPGVGDTSVDTLIAAVQLCGPH